MALSLVASAQQNGTFKKVTITDTLKLRGIAIRDIKLNFTSPSHYNLATQQAIYDLVQANKNHVWLITNLSDTTGIVSEIEGDIAYVSSGDTLAIRDSLHWLVFTGGSGGAFSSFTLAADSGTPAEIEDGETVTVAGGTGLSSVISANTVTLNMDNTAVTAGNYGSASQVATFTVGADGRLTAAANLAILIDRSQVNGITAGSVLFGATGGTIQQDNTGFYYDDTNNRVGVGTTSPIFTVSAVANNTDTGIGAFAHSATATQRSVFALLRSRGTSSTPTTVVANDLIGSFTGNGHDGTSYQTTARIDFAVSSTVSTNTVPQRISFTTGTTEANRTERMTVLHDGNIGIGTTTPTFILDINSTNAIRLPRGTTAQRPTSTAGLLRWNTSNTAVEYADGSTWYSLGTGTMSSWTLAGTSGTPQTVSNGQTATLAAGYGITTTAAATRTVTTAVDTTALKTPFFAKHLTGTTTVNTNGQQLWFRDAGAYPYTFMNSNYWIAASDVNTYMDVGSTAGNLTGNSATRMFLASAGSWEAQAATELRLDGDSIVIDATLPVNTNATHVLVRDAVSQRLEEKTISSLSTWLRPELEAGDVDIETTFSLSLYDAGTDDDVQYSATGVLQVGAGKDLVVGADDGLVFLTGDAATVINNNSSLAGKIRFREASTNGANFFEVSSSSSMTTNLSLSWPSSAPATESGILERDAAGNGRFRAVVHSAIAATTDASGDVTVSHNNDDGTFNVLVVVTGTTFYHVQVHTKTASTFKIRFFNSSGAAVTSTSVAADYTLTDI